MIQEDEKIGYNICKFLLIFFTIAAIIARVKLTEKLTDMNVYMAFINFFSLLFSINTFLLSLYIEFKKIKNQLKDRLISLVIMGTYLSIYVIDVIYILISAYFYFKKYSNTITIINDVYSILSLGLALTYDYLVRILSYFISEICS